MSQQYSLSDGDETIRLKQVWEQVILRLKDEVNVSTFDRFLRPLSAEALDGGTATVTAPTGFVYEYVRERFVSRLEDIISDELGEAVLVRIVLGNTERQPIERFDQTTVVTQDRPAAFKPHERLRFETFVVGNSNGLAYAGAKAVAESPGAKYNPLFIFGPPGLGKTHLLHSIAHELIRRDPKFSFAYLSAQQFMEDFVSALHSNRIEHFRRRHRGVNCWLLDDVHFVAGKERTQEEVFHTFNALYQMEKQIVLCSDRPPRDLFLTDERLRSRFEGGLVAEVKLPETETRCAILLAKACQDGIDLDSSVALFLAQEIAASPRVLGGALTKLAAEASLRHGAVTLELAQEIVDRHYSRHSQARPGYEEILDAVSRYFKIPVEEMRGKSRQAPIAMARHVAVYITRELTGDSWKHIGGHFGGRDHTSVMHAYQKISEMRLKERDLDNAIKQMIRNLYPD